MQTSTSVIEITEIGDEEAEPVKETPVTAPEHAQVTDTDTDTDAVVTETKTQVTKTKVEKARIPRKKVFFPIRLIFFLLSMALK